MNYLINISVAKRISLGFSFILLILILVIGLSIQRLNHVADATKEMMKDPIQTERLVSDWSRNLHAGITRATAIARSSDASLASFFAEDSKKSSQNSGELQKAVEALISSDTERVLFKEIGEQRVLYLKNRDVIVALKNDGRIDEAQLFLNEHFIPGANAYAKKMDDLLKNQRDQVDVLAHSIEENRQSSLTLLIVLGVLGVLLSINISWVMARSVTKPLALASDLAKKVAEGDLTSPIPPY